MTRQSYIETEDLRQIIEFVTEDDPAVLRTDVIARFMNLQSALTKKLQESLVKSEKENVRLECKMTRMKTKSDTAVRQGVFTDTQLDSADVAKALLYCLQQAGSNMYARYSMRLTKNKLILILYEMYASWLGSKKERLFVEHPQASEWGPQFWRAYKHVDIQQTELQETFSKLAEQNSGVAAFCRNSAQKYCDYSESDLKAMLLNSDPYRNALPEHNNGKWGKEISDADIYLWKSPKNGQISTGKAQ